MNELVRIELDVRPETAAALTDARRRRAMGLVIDRLVRPESRDPRIEALAAAVAQAEASGPTSAEVEQELAVYNAERRT